MQLRAKSIRAATSTGDGERIWIGRQKPRPQSAQRIDGWERDLAPSMKIEFALWRGWITAREHESLYLAEMWRQASRLRALGERAMDHPVTLLCGCVDHHRCHGDVVVRLVERLCCQRAALAGAR